jgi:hypothetical protein
MVLTFEKLVLVFFINELHQPDSRPKAVSNIVLISPTYSIITEWTRKPHFHREKDHVKNSMTQRKFKQFLQTRIFIYKDEIQQKYFVGKYSIPICNTTTYNGKSYGVP